jgi:hypothetical protein
VKRHLSGETEGRIVYRRLKLPLGFEYRSDLIVRDYMRRWTLYWPSGRMWRLHHILRSDNREHFHDHPMDFTSFILKGGYVEHRPGRPSVAYHSGSVVRRQAEDLHALELIGKSAWTFVVAGPVRRDWGFATEDGWVKAGDYDAWKANKLRSCAKSTSFFDARLTNKKGPK